MDTLFTKRLLKEDAIDPQKFRQRVIDGLLEHWTCTRKRKGRPSIAPLPLQMTGQHQRRLDKQLASCHVSSRPIRSLHFLIVFSNKFDQENLHSTRNK